MAKISSSQPPRRTRPSEAPPRPQRASRPASSGRGLKAAESQKSDKDSHESGALQSEGQAGTLGEALQKERELREDVRAFSPEAPWENAHAEKEDKQRADELHQKLERAQKKEPGQKQDARQQAGGAGRAPPRAGQQGAQAAGRPAGGSGFDGFEGLRGQAGVRQALPASPLGGLPIAPTPPPRLGGGAIHVLNTAKEPGVYFREEGREDGRTEEDEDPELAAAVEEAIRLLFGVRGVHQVGPGINDAGEPVIVIATSRGFSESSLRAVPDRVHRFKTLVALPYELLPLRRDVS